MLAACVALAGPCAMAVAASTGAAPPAPAGLALPCTHGRNASLAYLGKIVKTARALGVASDYPLAHHLVVAPEARRLVVAETDIYGRPLHLVPPAAAALTAMQAAARDYVKREAVSGYRRFAYQLRLVRARLDAGLTLGQVLRINDLPGYSEHESGCAVDLTTPGIAPVTATFAHTPAYRWLTAHAERFEFHPSYGRHNRHGVDFEPWHWRYAPLGTALTRAPSGPPRPRVVPPNGRATVVHNPVGVDDGHATTANQPHAATPLPHAPPEES